MLLLVLFHFAPFRRGIQKQESTRGKDGDFFSDGVRKACGGGPDTKRRGWKEGCAEWYHTIGQQTLPEEESARKDALKLVDEHHSAWRSCLGPVLTLLYEAARQSLGEVLVSYQTYPARVLPGLSDIRVHADVPYQHIDASMNANVGMHIDRNDFMGTTIWWMYVQAGGGVGSSPAATNSRSELGAAFVLFDLGMKFGIGHLTHVWCRSDLLVHGTIRNDGISPAVVSGKVTQASCCSDGMM